MSIERLVAWKKKIDGLVATSDLEARSREASAKKLAELKTQHRGLLAMGEKKKANDLSGEIIAIEKKLSATPSQAASVQEVISAVAANRDSELYREGYQSLQVVLADISNLGLLSESLLVDVIEARERLLQLIKDYYAKVREENALIRGVSGYCDMLGTGTPPLRRAPRLHELLPPDHEGLARSGDRKFYSWPMVT